jgi:hypothetical protein
MAFCTDISYVWWIFGPLLDVVDCVIQFVPEFRFVKANKDSRYQFKQNLFIKGRVIHMDIQTTDILEVLGVFSEYTCNSFVSLVL